MKVDEPEFNGQLHQRTTKSSRYTAQNPNLALSHQDLKKVEHEEKGSITSKWSFVREGIQDSTLRYFYGTSTQKTTWSIIETCSINSRSIREGLRNFTRDALFRG